MAKAKFDVKTEATRSLYAGAGVADLAVERVRSYVAGAQTRATDVQKNVSGLDPQTLRDQALKTVNSRVEALSAEAKSRRAAVEARVAELQADAKEIPARLQALLEDNVATLTGVYDGFAKRGETLVGRIRGQESTQAATAAAKTTTAKAKTTRTQAAKTTRSTAKKTTSGAKSTAKKAGSTAKKTPAKSSAKATATAAKTTAENATTAASDAAQKVGD